MAAGKADESDRKLSNTDSCDSFFSIDVGRTSTLEDMYNALMSPNDLSHGSFGNFGYQWSDSEDEFEEELDEKNTTACDKGVGTSTPRVLANGRCSSGDGVEASTSPVVAPGNGCVLHGERKLAQSSSIDESSSTVEEETSSAESDEFVDVLQEISYDDDDEQKEDEGKNQTSADINQVSRTGIL